MTRQKRWILAAVILGSSIVFLDSTIVNVALPTIGRELPASLVGRLEGQSFVYNAYLLSLSSLLILAGALSDYYGRRRMYTIGLIGFGITSRALRPRPDDGAADPLRGSSRAPPARSWCRDRWRS